MPQYVEAYTTQDIYGITSRLYKLLKDPATKLEFCKVFAGNVGHYNYETELMEIDYRCDIIPTLIHESLHKWNPDWCETKVLEAERKICCKITKRQAKNILKAFVKIL